MSIDSACYYALCHDTGSACCFSKISKWILSCVASLSRTYKGIATRFNRKIFCEIGKDSTYLPFRIIFGATEMRADMKTEYCNIHTGREDMCSHYVGAPRYACPDSFRGKREGMEIIY